MEGKKQQKHFVLVHGACHGAWCWYRLQTLLEAEGHHVTVIDLAAAGINPKKLDELRTFSEYTQPLFKVMESIPLDEKVVLVGHSLGGMNIAFAMEKYPHKISVAVFIAAYMPDTVHKPSYLIEKDMEQSSTEDQMDNQTIPFGKPEDHLVALVLGPQYISSILYQFCPPEDVALAKVLVRPSSTFLSDLSKQSAFSEERYGSIKRAYIITGQDNAFKVEFQRWIIKNTGAAIVKEIKGSGHMAMISKPHKLCQYLVGIAKEGKGPQSHLTEDFITQPRSPA